MASAQVSRLNLFLCFFPGTKTVAVAAILSIVGLCLFSVVVMMAAWAYMKHFNKSACNRTVENNMTVAYTVLKSGVDV